MRRRRLRERALDVCQRHAILRAFRPGHARLDLRQIEFQHVRIVRRAFACVEQPDRLRVGFNEGDAASAPRQAEIIQRPVIHRKQVKRRAVFGRHVRNHGTIRHGQRGNAGAEIFHEFFHDAVFAQHLRHGQQQVSRGHFWP